MHAGKVRHVEGHGAVVVVWEGFPDLIDFMGKCIYLWSSGKTRKLHHQSL